MEAAHHQKDRGKRFRIGYVTSQKNGGGKQSGSRTGLDAARASVYIYVAASALTLEQGRNAAALTLEQKNSFFNTPGINMCT